MEKEHLSLSLSRGRRGEAVPRLGVDRGSHPVPASKAELKEGKGSWDGAGPGDKAKEEAGGGKTTRNCKSYPMQSGEEFTNELST